MQFLSEAAKVARPTSWPVTVPGRFKAASPDLVLELVRHAPVPGEGSMSAVIADDLQLIDRQMWDGGVPAYLSVVVERAENCHGRPENVVLDKVGQIVLIASQDGVGALEEAVVSRVGMGSVS